MNTPAKALNVARLASTICSAVIMSISVECSGIMLKYGTVAFLNDPKSYFRIFEIIAASALCSITYFRPRIWSTRLVGALLIVDEVYYFFSYGIHFMMLVDVALAFLLPTALQGVFRFTELRDRTADAFD